MLCISIGVKPEFRQQIKPPIFDVAFELAKKVVRAIVIRPDSDASRAGYDLTFRICSHECGVAFQKATESGGCNYASSTSQILTFDGMAPPVEAGL
jgi:hypothetical protein